MDIEQIMHQLKASMDFLVNYHCDKSFASVLTGAKKLAVELETEAC